MEKNQKIKYPKKKGSAGASGQFFEIKLATFLYLKGLSEEIEYFYLASNSDEAHAFDDVVFKYKYIGSNKPNILFIQMKHRDVLQNKDKRREKDTLTYTSLFSGSKGKFSLQKYFSSYLKIRQQFSDLSTEHPIFGGNFDDCDFIIYTNLQPTHDKSRCSDNEKKGFLKVTASEYCVFDLLQEDRSKPVHYYRVIYDERDGQDIIDDLNYSSDCMNLARELAKSCFIPTGNSSELVINLKEGIFENYRIPLAQNVLEMGEKADSAMFRESFLDGNESLSVHDREFRHAFFEEAEKISEISNDDLKYELKTKDIKISKKFWNTDYVKPNEHPKLILPSDTVDANDIKEFLGNLKFFLNQPHEQELEKIIKCIIQEMYRIETPDIDSVFHSLMGELKDWWQNADYYLTKKEKILEDILRVSIFTVEGYVGSFTGREKELSQLHKALQRNDTNCSITVISHMTAVSGLGGIGKTELARKYAWDYKHFYDENVLWINAESFISLKDSFFRLAQHPRISIPTEHKNGKEKPVGCVVSEIYDFFAKRKSLFIFDNAERSGDVNQFLPLHPLTPDCNQPYILITSREREWERGIKVIEIKDLELEDAIQFVGKYLNITEVSEEEEVMMLVGRLQCFPLALQQAVAYIADQRVVGEFSILDYLNEYDRKTESLLISTVFQGISNRYAKTTYTTWQITIDKIKTKGGGLATEILNIAGYLSPEKIKRKLFYNLADAAEGDVKQAVRLLVNYCIIGSKNDQSILNIHRLVQHVTRLNLEKESVNAERVLRKALELTNFIEKRDLEHFVSVWTYASKYGKLIDEFFFQNFYCLMPYSSLCFLDENGSYQAVEAILEHIREKHPDRLSGIINEENWKIGGNLLHRAAISGNLNAVKYLVTNGAIIDAKCAYSQATYLFYLGKQKILPTCPLYKNGKFVLHISDTPLHCAAYSGNEDVVAYLICKGANVNAMNKVDATPLHIACIFGNINVANLLFDKGADVNAGGVYKTPLDYASALGNLDLVKFLIRAGANTDATCDAYGKFYTTPLHMAALAQNFNVLEFLLDNGANVSVKNSWGQTPLHNVSEEGNLHSAKYLLEKGADFNSPDNINRTPLHLAAEKGHLEVVRLLYEKGADFNLPENDGNTPLHIASRVRNFDVVKFIVENGADFNIPNNHGDTPLHIATEICHFDVLKFLVGKGADFISPNNYGSTPLHLSVKSNLRNKSSSVRSDVLKIVTYLIEKGADIASPDNEGSMPVHLAFRTGKFEVASLLIEKGPTYNYPDKNGSTPIHWVARKGFEDLVKLLVESGADFNTPDRNGNTPLHHAAANIYPNELKYLMGKGADFHSANNQGKSPIHLAAEIFRNHSKEMWSRYIRLWEMESKVEMDKIHMLSETSHDVVTILIENGASFETLDRDNRAPIHLAAEAGNTAVVKLLIKKGADFISPDKYGCTPLHLASGTYDTNNLKKCDLVKILIENGANFEVLDMHKRAPIHIAAQCGNIDVVKFLLEKGADFTSPDKYGYTLLHLAVGNGHLHVVRLLLEKGVDVNLHSKDGYTPLHLAYANYYKKMEKLLEDNGADPVSRDNHGNEPINSAAGVKRYQWLFSKISEPSRLRNKARARPIFVASEMGFLHHLPSIIKKGADINVRDDRGRIPLHNAAQNDHYDVAEFLIGEGADFACADTNGNTPLHLAIAAGDEKRGKLRIGTVNIDSHAAKFLINKGVRLDSPDNNGRTPMHWAAKTRKFDVLRLLVEKGADFNCLDRDQKTPLHWAAEKGCLAAVKLLMEKGAHLNPVDKNNRTPMHWAAKEGHLDVVKFLLRKGADFNLYEKNGITPLHVAACYGQFYIVKFLLSEGADFNSRENQGNTPLHLAARQGRLNIIIHLVEKGCDLHVKNKKGKTPLHFAAASGNLNVVQYLITKDGDFNINDKDYSGNTILSSAALGGKLAVVKFLVEKRNADFEMINNSGNTPLHLAALKDAFFVVKYFVEELHVNLKASNNVGNTALHIAARKGSLNVVKYLIEKNNVDFKVTNNCGDTVLHLAAGIGSLHIVKYLIEEKNVDCEVTNYSGDTALHVASGIGSLCIVKYLIEDKNCDYELNNYSGDTALHLAAGRDSLSIVEYLIEDKNCDFQTPNYSGDTPLDLAARKGSIHVVKYLNENQSVI